MNAFHVIGTLTAAWAVLLAAYGVRRHEFPASRLATRSVIGISVLLVAGSIGSGVVTGALEEAEEEEAAAAPEDAGEAAPGEARGDELSIAAVPSGELAFDTSSLRAEPGTVAITMENPSTVPHNISLEGDGVDEEGETVGEGGTSEVAADLDPGEYSFYCSVPGHREGGMEGTLTVE